MLTIEGITFRIAGRTLFEGASLSVPAGHRIGLIGKNGAGKSTLFHLISGELEADAGEIRVASGTAIGWVRQDLPDDDTPLIEVVLAADTERASLLAESEISTDPDRLGEIYTRLADIDAYQAPARAAIILAGLGFDESVQSSPISDFSGGWRMRVALAAALFRAPDLLLLDEPTNHLDVEAIIWLEQYLANYPHTLIMISHDRDILNKMVTHIAHLDQCQLTLYKGSYDQFETARAQKLLNHQALFEKQQAQKKKMMAFVDRFRAKATKAKQAQSRLKAIERMEMVDALIAERAIALDFPSPETLPSPLITLDNVQVGYSEGVPVLKDLNLRIDMEDRIALLGANGNGKSTLVKLLSGALDAMAGKVQRSSKIRIGYFAQHQAEELDMNSTPYGALQQVAVGLAEAKLRAILGSFGFDKQKADTCIAELSGGEKARLLFCLMSYHAPHIMLLDEPTNHLDIEMREALLQALNAYSGCVILVSHDPHLVECVAEQLWLVGNKTVTSFDGDLAAYRKLVIEQRKKERNRSDRPGKKEKKKSSSSSRSVMKKRLASLEKDMHTLEGQKQIIEQTLENLAVGVAPDSTLLEEYEAVQQKLEITEIEWLEAQEALESL